MNNKFKFIKTFILLGLILSAYPFFSQDNMMRDKIKDKVKSQRVAYITEQLDLTETEAQKFWPVYNGYQSEITQLKSSMDITPKRDMTDKEAEDLMYTMLDGRTKEIEIQKKYIQKMKTAIPSRKIAMLFRAEREFKEKVVSNIRERRKERKGN